MNKNVIINDMKYWHVLYRTTGEHVYKDMFHEAVLDLRDELRGKEDRARVIYENAGYLVVNKGRNTYRGMWEKRFYPGGAAAYRDTKGKLNSNPVPEILDLVHCAYPGQWYSDNYRTFAVPGGIVMYVFWNR